MSERKFVLGIDGGTESIRCCLFDAYATGLGGKFNVFSHRSLHYQHCAGNLRGSGAATYATAYPRPSLAEQNPADWWKGLSIAVHGALQDAEAAAGDVAALCLDSTCCTVVALDSDGEALRPAILWMDMRASAQAARVAQCSSPFLRVNGGGLGPVSAEWMIPKALWIKENEPTVYNNANTICEYQDYINYRLTGRLCCSINNLSVRWHYSSVLGWPLDILEQLEMPELVAKWPQVVLKLGDIVGPLLPEAAEHLGLMSGIPVVQGGSDASLGVLGLGVVDPNNLAMLTGSSHLHLGLTSDESLCGRGMFGCYTDAILPGIHVIEGGQTSTGSIVSWYASLVQCERSYDALCEAAERIRPGSDGLFVLDHFQGNRTPHVDPLSRGAMLGLTLMHTRAHIFRAILEGICFGTERVLETMRAGGFAPTKMRMGGGPTASRLWVQMHADVSNMSIDLVSPENAPARGCAILAAVAVGMHASVRDAVERMVHVQHTAVPDHSMHDKYRRIYDIYKLVYPSVAPIFHALHNLNEPT